MGPRSVPVSFSRHKEASNDIWYKNRHNGRLKILANNGLTNDERMIDGSDDLLFVATVTSTCFTLQRISKFLTRCIC